MWGERAAAGFFEDLHVLILVVAGTALLLASFASAYAAYERARSRADLQAEADRLLSGLLADPALLHGSEAGVLERVALEHLTGAALDALLGGGRRARLVVSERSGPDPITFVVQTGPEGTESALASTAAVVWHSDVDVRAARVGLALWR